MKLVITAKQAKEIFFEDTEEFEIVEEADWEDEGKYQYGAVIFKKDNRFYSLDASRTGSYFTDWHYSWEDEEEFDCYEVEKKEITKTIWAVKKPIADK